LQQARLADELGFERVWAIEQHFLEGHSHNSAPEVFLTACAFQTTRVRLGMGVVCSPQVNHPVRLAERAAVLDILSAGRVDLAAGRSATWSELGGFGASGLDTRKAWDEYVRVIPRMWVQDTFAWQGESFSMPERAILPKPLQQPHPPLWASVASPAEAMDAADRGLGVVCLTFHDVDEQAELVRQYRRQIVSCEPAGEFVHDRIDALNFLLCGADGDEAARKGAAMREAYALSAGQFLSVGEAGPSRSSRPAEAPPEGRLSEGLAAGDPDRVARVLKEWEATGVDGVNFVLNAGGVLGHDEVANSLRLFAREVMPAFADQPAAAAATGAA
jgi:alkanesulfonate monooxygenase SsuD/methylene tetrahydromethanopterin reductase-like flavin-dependent oxidoreductase (luciferase family)